MKHKHADLMLEYAKDAQTNNKPFELWEFKLEDKWHDLDFHPPWNETTDYRKKVTSEEIQAFLKGLPLDVPTSMQAELYVALSKQEPFYEDYGQFCGGYQTLKFRVMDLIYTVGLNPEGELLDITYIKKKQCLISSS